MLLPQLLAALLAAHVAGFAQGYVAGRAVCAPPAPPAARARAPAIPRGRWQPERGNRRF